LDIAIYGFEKREFTIERLKSHDRHNLFVIAGIGFCFRRECFERVQDQLPISVSNPCGEEALTVQAIFEGQSIHYRDGLAHRSQASLCALTSPLSSALKIPSVAFYPRNSATMLKPPDPPPPTAICELETGHLETADARLWPAMTQASLRCSPPYAVISLAPARNPKTKIIAPERPPTTRAVGSAVRHRANAWASSARLRAAPSDTRTAWGAAEAHQQKG
jgi:hypothetical protein